MCGRRLPHASPRVHLAALRMATGDGAPAAGGAESPVMETLKLGIKAVGVGVSGSKPIPNDLAQDLIAIIQSAAAPPAAWAGERELIQQRLASFLGTLFVKVSHAEGDVAVLAAVAAAAGGSVTAPGDRVREGCSSSQILHAAVRAACCANDALQSAREAALRCGRSC